MLQYVPNTIPDVESIALNVHMETSRTTSVPVAMDGHSLIHSIALEIW